MGCIFGSLGSVVSVILDALERISMWTVCAILTCCLAITILIVLLIGIGIGYHYCYIHYAGSGKWNKTRQSNFFYDSFNQFIRENIHRITKREVKADGIASVKTENRSYIVTRTPTFNLSKSYIVM